MKISNYMNLLNDRASDSGRRRLDRLETRRERKHQPFDNLRQVAVDAAASARDQKILDSLEST